MDSYRMWNQFIRNDSYAVSEMVHSLQYGLMLKQLNYMDNAFLSLEPDETIRANEKELLKRKSSYFSLFTG